MPPVGLEPVIPVSEQLLGYNQDRAAIGIGLCCLFLPTALVHRQTQPLLVNRTCYITVDS
jgi:hypothetical protein